MLVSRPASMRGAILVCVVVSIGASSAGVARAQGPWEGQWRAGATQIQVQVQSWGRDCGPRPASTTVPAAGTIRISQQGDHLTFHGSRTTRTNACWSENRLVRRIASSYQGSTWTTRCRTNENDPRSETEPVTIRASGEDRLQLRDVSQYDLPLNEPHCEAPVPPAQPRPRVP